MSASSYERGDRLRVFAILAMILSIPLIAKIPFGGELIMVGQFPTGAAVVTIFDIYFLILVIGLVLFYQEVYIPQSVIILALCGVVFTSAISLLMNGVTSQGLVEVVQWVQMGTLVTVVGFLLQSKRDIEWVLQTLVYVGTAKALWTLVYFSVLGYPGRRFNALVEGVALITLIGLLIYGRQERSLTLQLIPLVSAVTISQERKVWAALVVSLFAITSVYVIAEQEHKVRTVAKGLAVTSVALLVPIWFFDSPEILARMATLLSLLPGIGNHTRFERLYIYRTGLEIFRYNPILGVGPDGWYGVANRYATDNFAALQQHTDVYVGPHSIFVKIISETGIMGFTFFLLLIVQPLRFAGYYFRDDASERAKTLALTMFGIFIFVIFYASVYSSSTLIRVFTFLPFGILLSFQLNNLGDSDASREDHTV